MVYKRPTHQVKHLNGFTVNIYIHPNILSRLGSRDDKLRQAAKDAICIAFRKAAVSKYHSRWTGGNWVQWSQIEVKPLESDYDEPMRDDRICDDCAMCDLGHHERCRQRDGCPNAYSYRR